MSNFGEYQDADTKSTWWQDCNRGVRPDTPQHLIT